MGVRKEISVDRKENVRELDGVMVRKLRLGEKWWRVIGVYVNKDLETKLQFIKEWMEDKEEGARVVIRGDFNVRTGRKGDCCVEERMGER